MTSTTSAALTCSAKAVQRGRCWHVPGPRHHLLRNNLRLSDWVGVCVCVYGSHCPNVAGRGWVDGKLIYNQRVLNSCLRCFSALWEFLIFGSLHRTDQSHQPNMKPSLLIIFSVVRGGEERSKVDSLYPWSLSSTPSRNSLQIYNPPPFTILPFLPFFHLFKRQPTPDLTWASLYLHLTIHSPCLIQKNPTPKKENTWNNRIMSPRPSMIFLGKESLTPKPIHFTSYCIIIKDEYYPTSTMKRRSWYSARCVYFHYLKIRQDTTNKTTSRNSSYVSSESKGLCKWSSMPRGRIMTYLRCYLAMHR